MLIIMGTIRLAPERLADAHRHMATMVEASRHEDGCQLYAYAEDLFDPGLIRVNEIWRDQSALDAHLHSEHIKVWRAVWSELGLHDRRLVAYEAGEARPI